MAVNSASDQSIRRLSWTLVGLIAAFVVVIVCWYKFGFPEQERDERIAGAWRSIDKPSIKITMGADGIYDIARNAGITEEIGNWSTNGNTKLMLDSTSEDPAKHTDVQYHLEGDELSLSPGLLEGAERFRREKSPNETTF